MRKHKLILPKKIDIKDAWMARRIKNRSTVENRTKNSVLINNKVYYIKPEWIHQRWKEDDRG